METPQTGYQVKTYNVPVKRYCQTLDLRDSPELIAEYRKRHSQAEVWPEILAGIHEVGILEMERRLPNGHAIQESLGIRQQKA